MFDPLRNDPRFQKLAESEAPKSGRNNARKCEWPGGISPPGRLCGGLTYFINVTRRLSHLCVDGVNGSDQLPLLKISQTRRPGPQPFTDQEAPLKPDETIARLVDYEGTAEYRLFSSIGHGDGEMLRI
jgi:hypothetical protein